MQITRNEHQRSMARTVPGLLLLYVLQVVTYAHFLPHQSAGDIALFLGVGLSILILVFTLYDHFHRIILRPNFIEIKLGLLGIEEEILYQKISHLEIKRKGKYYAHIILHLSNGKMTSLYNVDSPDLVAEFIEKKRIRR